MLRRLTHFIIVFFIALSWPLKAQLNNILFRSEGTIPEELVTSESDKLRKYERADKKGDEEYYRALVISMQNMLENNVLIYGNSTQKYMQALVDDILLKNGLKENIKLFQINSTVVNAFSIEPGYIFISTGMVANMLSEDNLYMVLCHEVAHITNHHSKKFHEAKRKLAKKEEMDMQDPVGDFIKKVLSYSRDQEREADKTGISYFANSGRHASSVVRTYSLLSNDSVQHAPWVRSFFTDLDLNPDGPGQLGPIQPKKYDLSSAVDDSADSELWSSHPDPKNRLKYVKEMVAETQFRNTTSENSEFAEMHQMCLLNYALLCNINGEFLNVLHAGVLYRYLYPQSSAMDIMVSSAIANEVLYVAKPKEKKSEKRRKKNTFKVNKEERDFSWAQPGVAKLLAEQIEDRPAFVQTVLGTYAYRNYESGGKATDLLPYLAAVRYRLVRRKAADTNTENNKIISAYYAMSEDSALIGYGKFYRAAEWRKDSLNEIAASKTLKEGKQRLYADMRSTGEHSPIEQVRYFQLHTWINRSSESNMKLKQRLIKYTKKEVQRINALTEIHVNDSFIERATLTTEILNRSNTYNFYLREKNNRTNDALPLLMDAQFPDAKALKNDILVDVLIVPDIMIYYATRIRKSVVVLINVQKLGMDDPLYFIVRVNLGRLQRGVLGNFIYNAIKQAEQ